jgi:hypothetical protein
MEGGGGMLHAPAVSCALCCSCASFEAGRQKRTGIRLPL